MQYIDNNGKTHQLVSTSGTGYTRWLCSCGQYGVIPDSIRLSVRDAAVTKDWKKHIEMEPVVAAHTLVSDGEVGPKTTIVAKYKDSDVKDLLFEILLRLERIEKSIG